MTWSGQVLWCGFAGTLPTLAWNKTRLSYIEVIGNKLTGEANPRVMCSKATCIQLLPCLYVKSNAKL
jgi:hypothetical protein